VGTAFSAPSVVVSQFLLMHLRILNSPTYSSPAFSVHPLNIISTHMIYQTNSNNKYNIQPQHYDMAV